MLISAYIVHRPGRTGTSSSSLDGGGLAISAAIIT
jgi:hypothetical protein